MSLTRYSLILCVPALAFLAGVAHAQTLTSSGSPSLTYAKSSEIVTPQTVSITSTVDSTSYMAVPVATWLSAVPTTGVAGTAGGSGADTLTLSVVTSVTDAMAAGAYNTTVALQVAGVTAGTVSVSLTLTSATSPLSSSPTSISLTYISHGVANQTSAKTTSTISDNDTAADTYTIQSSSVPSWLTVTSAHGTASLTATDTLTFTVVQSAANALSSAPSNATVHLLVANNPDLVITVSLALVAQQPLATTTTALDFTYTIGGTVPAAQSATVTVASGSQAFNLDPSTVPAWLTATASGTASTNPFSVTFTPVTAVVKGLAAGNYSGSVGYEAAGAESELTIPVVLTVSNPTATISLKGASTNPSILNLPGGTIPTPVVTVLSSDEPVGFSATCAVTTTYPAYVPTTTPCVLSGASTAAVTVTGIAYTFGTALTTTFDSALFSASTPFGTVVTETVTVTAGTQSPVTQSYSYSIQPIAPTFTAVSPTSAAAIASTDSLVVTLTGTNFVGPNSILGTSSLSPTRVFVGTTDVTSDAVVVSGTVMLVSVPAADFPTIASGKTTAAMVLGVANETGTAAPTAATATETLTITTAPVVYAVTSTATYLQPAPGAKPSVAPYELISIFGANFGTFSTPGSATGALSAYNQFGDTVNVSGAGTTASPYVTLSVSFKIGSTTYKSPILFANATQINCIVPSALTIGQSAAVTVTSGANVSDGLFTVNVVAAQPGIFTLASDGVGQGAILNPGYSVNSSTNPATAGSVVAIYMTGLGIPNSTAVDNSSATGGYSTGCVVISDTTSGSPGYMQLVNTSTPHSTPPYTAPTTAWTNIDGAVIESQFLLGSALPPCFVNSGSTAVTVTFGTTAVTGSAIGYAGFAGGSVAGLYQVNVTVPEGLTTGNVPVTVTLGTEGTSPAGVVTIAVH